MTSWRVRLARAGAATIPVLLKGDETTPRGDVVTALRSVGYLSDRVYLGGEAWSAGDDTPMSDAGLSNGATFSDVPDDGELLASGTYVVVVGGPASGIARSLAVEQPMVIGRSPSGNGLMIDDELMSSEHLSIRLADDGTVRVSDLGSRNGSEHEGMAFTDTTFEPNTIVRAGSSLFAIMTVADHDRAVIRGRTATGLNLHRQFREAQPVVPESPKPPKKPNLDRSSMSMPWWRSLMPLVTAVGMAWMFGRWQFLLIAALSPIVYGFDNVRRKKRTKRENAEKEADYELQLERHRAAMAELRSQEARRLRRGATSGGQATLLARFRHRRVWERRTTDDDFLTATLGYAGLPSAYDDDGDDREMIWQAPLSISLDDEGPLSVTGPRERAVAVVRSLLVGLMFTHAPTDVKLWVITDEASRDEWDFATWLPHAFTAEGGALVATTDEARATLMRSLKAMIEGRREEAAASNDKVSFQKQLVVIDGVDNIAPADLTEVLRDGPALGIIGIVSDPTVIPEGVRGEIVLGRYDDECSYRSVATPRVDGVVVSQVTRDAASAAALALAPLEAFGASGAGRPLSTVFFTQMIGYGERSPEGQLKAWRDSSPTTVVPVGVDLDEQVINIDIVKQGPHGLVGGTTRSGKTEFIKTYLASLAVHNTPDDLAMVIVDFKNAVDYPELGRLPHVLAVATNSDADQFDRTLTLITAELDRRGELFREVAGVATIEGYQSALATRPELPPVPRLLIVVDEFAKLMNSDEGKAQIGRLEDLSLAGAAFGIHLLLITQDFSGKLPPQINEQSGLRVCFKVLSNGPSRAVLNSGAASTIPATTPGRAYLRSKGGDLVQFQSARVANRALNLGGDASEVEAHHVSWDSLVMPPAAPLHSEAPNEEQDLYRVIDVARRAALDGGWATSPVPWPDELSDQIGIVDLHERFPHDRRMLIGAADQPALQRMVPIQHSFSDDVVGLIGVSDSGHHDALLSMAGAIAAATNPDDVHMYGIDMIGRGLSLIEPLPHVGTVANRDDATGVRILNWLLTQTSVRRSSIARAGATDFESYQQLGGRDLNRIVLFVLGIDRMVLHAEGTTSPLQQPMTKLINEAAGTGIQVVFSGNPAMASNRFGTAASRRFVFHFNDPGDYPPVVPKSLRSRLDVFGRCVDSRTDLLSQIGYLHLETLGDEHRETSQREVLLGIANAVDDRYPNSRPPQSFAPAPWPLHFDEIKPSSMKPPDTMQRPLAFGVNPENGAVLWIDPTEDGTAFRIVGDPKSGRSTALAAIAIMARPLGWDVIMSAVSRRSSLYDLPDLAATLVSPEEMLERVGTAVERPTLVLVDDAHRLDEEFPWKQLAEVESGLVVTVVAGSTDGLTSMQFNRRLGITGGAVLMPTRARDATAVGASSVSDDWVLNPLAGVGIAGIASEAFRVQFPLVH